MPTSSALKAKKPDPKVTKKTGEPRKRRIIAEGRTNIRGYGAKRGSAFVHVGRETVDLIEGRDDVSTWTDAQLIRGYKSKRGRPPRFLPRDVYDELIKRVFARIRHRFAAELEYAMEIHFDIIKDEDAPYAVRLKAIEMLYDRVLGKPEERVTLTADGDLPWQKMMQDVFIVANEDQAAKVVEANGKKKQPQEKSA